MTRSVDELLAEKNDPTEVARQEGYDQAVRDVMEELQKRSPATAAEMLEGYPEWAEIMAGCNGQ